MFISPPPGSCHLIASAGDGPLTALVANSVGQKPMTTSPTSTILTSPLGILKIDLEIMSELTNAVHMYTMMLRYIFFVAISRDK